MVAWVLECDKLAVLESGSSFERQQILGLYKPMEPLGLSGRRFPCHQVQFYDRPMAERLDGIERTGPV